MDFHRAGDFADEGRCLHHKLEKDVAFKIVWELSSKAKKLVE